MTSFQGGAGKKKSPTTHWKAKKKKTKQIAGSKLYMWAVHNCLSLWHTYLPCSSLLLSPLENWYCEKRSRSKAATPWTEGSIETFLLSLIQCHYFHFQLFIRLGGCRGQCGSGFHGLHERWELGFSTQNALRTYVSYRGARWGGK